MNFRKLVENFKSFLKEDSSYPQDMLYLQQLIRENDKNLRDMSTYEKNMKKVMKEFQDKYYRTTHSGAFRKTFFFLDEKDYVMKVALKPKSLKQNEQEAYIGRNPKYTEWFTKVYENHPRFIWIISERVQSLHWDEGIDYTGDKGKYYNTDWRVFLSTYAEIQKYGFEHVFEQMLEILRKVYNGNESGSKFDVGLQRTLEIFNKNIYRKEPSQYRWYKKADADRILYTHMKNWYSEFSDFVQTDKASQELVQLALELPKFELWDIRRDNLGRRANGEIVILDSSMSISSGK